MERIMLLGMMAVLVAVALLLPAISASAAQNKGDVWHTKVSGIIDPALSGYLVKTMQRAAAAGAAALVVEIDTPGGLDSSMRDIIQAELDAPIPVIFYVYPQGARAASAGVYILMGADVAAMAPQTNLGSATPVALNGSLDDTMEAKIVNDAAAYIKGLARTHGRNEIWVEQAVRQSVSLPSEEALNQNVVDFVAPDLPSLLRQVDGHVAVPKGITLRTAGAPVHEESMGWIQRFLHAIANPNIAYVLMIVGILGIALEFATPGLGVSGIAGVIAVMLGFYSFQVLPVSILGIALVVLAMILYVAEIKIQSHGILGIGGTVALILGGLFLFDTSAPFLRVSWPVLVVAAVIVLAFFMIVVRAVSKAMRRPQATGMQSLIGTTGVVLSDLDPEGQIRIRGEIWRARVEAEALHENDRIEVVRSEGLTLIVRRAKEGS